MQQPPNWGPQQQGYGYYGRPPRKSSNTVWWLLGLGGGAIALFFVLILASMMSPGASKARAAEAASASAAIAAANAKVAAQNAAADAALHKACKVAAAKHIEGIDPSSMKVQCHELVRNGLKAPSTAEFPGLFDSDSSPTSLDGCKTVYASYVDAQNAFGAKLRTRYICTYDPVTGLVHVDM